MRFLFRKLAIDQPIWRFAFEASEDLFGDAELKRRTGLHAEPSRMSRNDIDWKSIWANHPLRIQSAGTARDFAHSLIA